MTTLRLSVGLNWRLILGTVVVLLAVAGSTTASAADIAVNLGSYGALCDGVHDDRPALEAAIADVQAAGGGTITVPSGTCRIIQTASTIFTPISGPVTILGASPDATLSLDSDVVGDYRELFRVLGDNIVLKDLKLTRSRDVFTVLLKVFGSSGFTLDNVVIDGRQDVIGGADFDAIQLSGGAGETISDLHIDGTTIKNATFGLFQANDTRGTVDGVTVDHSTFTGNFGDDLEFNAPESSMSNITVTNSSFTNNKFTDPSVANGIGVGFANVQTAKVQNNDFSGYTYDPVHIEDRSSHITVDNNRFANSFTAELDFASMIFIVDNSHYISVTNNTFDTSANTNAVACVYASSGGSPAGPPSDITITGNTFKLRPNTTDFANYGATNITMSDNTYVTLP
jgi:hypothetical protein